MKAYELDPNDPDTLELLKQHNVQPPQKAAPPPPPPPVLQAPAAAASTNGASHAPTNGAAARPAAQGQQAPAQGQARARPASGAQGRAVQRRPAYAEESQSGISELSEVPRRRGKRSGSATATIGILIVAIAGAAAYFVIGGINARNNACAAKALIEGQKELRRDSYDGYKKAISDAEDALQCKPKSGPAHAMLAYAHAIRWGEHGSSDDRGPAEEHLTEALKDSDKPTSYLLAAQALIPYYSGNSKEALETIAKNIEKTGGRGGLLLLTQGIMLMNDGDLDGAREALDKAQQNAQDDARVYAALGMLNRRRGLDREALQNFDTARRFEKNHVDSILGMAQLVLDLPDPGGGYVTQAKELKGVIDAQPPASPRQQAMAHVLRALLISRVSMDAPLYTDVEFQKKLYEGTGVEKDAAKNKAAIQAEENQGFNIDAKNPELFLIRGKRLFFEKNLEGAAAEMRKAIAMAGTRVHFHVELAKVLILKEGGEAEAEAALRKALTIVPENPKLQTMLGQVLAKEKRTDDAISTLEKAVKVARDPQSHQRNPEAFYILGHLYRDDKKDIPKAIENLQQAGAQAFGEIQLGGRADDELAQLFDQKGDKGAARANFEKAINADADNDAATCHFARFLIKGGDAKDKDHIKDLAKKYLELAPKGECVGELRALAQ